MAVEVIGPDIKLTAGDTGVVPFTVGGGPYSDRDRALFTVKNSSGVVMFERQFGITTNRFELQFTNAMTDKWPAGSYPYDIRVVVLPIYDADGRIVDGSGVDTGVFENGQKRGNIVIDGFVGEV